MLAATRLMIDLIDLAVKFEQEAEQAQIELDDLQMKHTSPKKGMKKRLETLAIQIEDVCRHARGAWLDVC
jgi:hypothetical protein